MEELFKRLDRIEEKLDTAIERTIKAEADVSWLRGHVRLAGSALLALITGLTAALWQLMSHKGP